jgi:hypothetical protein
MFNFLRNCYKQKKITAEQVWEAADEKKITAAQARLICGPRRTAKEEQ